MPKNGSRAGAFCLGLALSAWCGERFAPADEPRLNQIQVIGSHNSYHIAPDMTVMELIAATEGKPGKGVHVVPALVLRERVLPEAAYKVWVFSGSTARLATAARPWE